jgi:uncharacterized protein (TIGR03118 family)
MFAKTALSRSRFLFAMAACAGAATIALSAAMDQCANEQDLVSDQSGGSAAHQDANLVNAWGVAFVPGGFAWVANNHSATSTAYDGAGTALPLVVTIPGPTAGTAGAPTGVVHNPTADFTETNGVTTEPATLIFAGEDGVISAWNNTIDGTTGRKMADQSSANAIYKGIAMANDGSSNHLYATDFHNGKIDVFDKTFALVPSAGGFADKQIPKGYAPFGIQNVGGLLYVTYAQQDANKQDDTPGKSKGFVDCFDANGFKIRRFAQRAHLNAPWGMAQAPSDFGAFGGNLLVGNFGDGTVTAFDVETGHFMGQLRGADGKTKSVEGLWGIAFGNDAHSQPHATLFFAAGPGGEAHGLYGRLDGTACPTHGH